MSPIVKNNATRPFDPSHPSLNHRQVVVRARLMIGSDCGYDAVAIIEWSRLTLDERLELERLLAKACS